MRHHLLLVIPLGLLLPGCSTGNGSVMQRTARTAPTKRYTHEVKGALRTVAGIQVLTLLGTPEEMGYSEGALLCGRVTRFFQGYYLDFLGALLKRSLKSWANIRDRSMKTFVLSGADEARLRALLLGMRERCKPEDLLIQEAKDVPRRDLQLEDLVAGLALVDFLLSACSSFTTWGEASATGGTLHGRNLDFLPDPGGTFLRQQMIKVHLPEGGAPAWASLAWPANPGCPTCFAEDGSGQSGHGASGPPSETLAGNALSMLAARDAFLASLTAARAGKDRVAAAEAALEQRATMTRGGNLHLFWPGGAAVLEYDGVRSHADGRVTVRTQAGGSLLCVNAFAKRRAAPYRGEVKAMHEILARGISSTDKMDARAAWQLMSASAAANKIPTLHTLVMDVKSKKLLLSFARTAGQDSNLVKPAEIELGQLFAR